MLNNETQIYKLFSSLLKLVAGFLVVLVAVILLQFMGVFNISAQNQELFWYLSRSSGIIAYILLWLSMLLGLILSSRFALQWKKVKPFKDLHQFISLLGLAFVFFHGVILVGDAYLAPSFYEILIPFQFKKYEPVLIGLGQVSLYLWAVLALSFYVRKRIGRKVWRLIHYASFLAYIFVTWHGIFAGTDSARIWMAAIYGISFSTILFFVVYRVFTGFIKPAEEVADRNAAQRQ